MFEGLYSVYLNGKLAGVKNDTSSVLVLLALVGGTSGCDYLGLGYIADGKDAVRQHLRNPDSATFRDVYVSQANAVKTVCGQVNSRNREGDFIGYQRFYSQGDPANTFLENTTFEFSIQWNKFCE